MLIYLPRKCCLYLFNRHKATPDMCFLLIFTIYIDFQKKIYIGNTTYFTFYQCSFSICSIISTCCKSISYPTDCAFFVWMRALEYINFLSGTCLLVFSVPITCPLSQLVCPSILPNLSHCILSSPVHSYRNVACRHYAHHPLSSLTLLHLRQPCQSASCSPCLLNPVPQMPDRLR